MITVNINITDTVYFNKDKRLWVINDKKQYPSNQYKLRIIKDSPVEKLPTEVYLKKELDALNTITTLVKNLNTLNNQYKKFLEVEKTGNKSETTKKLLLVNKSRKTVSKKLSKLNRDSHFGISENTTDNCYCIHYKGDFVTTNRNFELLCDGVF